MANYIYSISEDFSNGLDEICLHNKIENYGFSNQFIGLLKEGDVLKVMFIGSLSGNDEDDLDTIVSQHDPDDCEEEYDIGIVINGVGEVESLEQSSTNSTRPIGKVKMVLEGIEAGRYRIGWYYEWAHSSSKYDFRARVMLDEETTIMYHSQEIKETRNQNIPQCGYAYCNLTEGNHYITLDYWTERQTVYIQNTKLEIWRVK